MLMKLNESQLRSADHFTGPALILSGPGSGKTAVITHRVKKLIEKYHVAPENILVASFSRAAAREMEERFLKISNLSGHNPVFGTFHSIFFSILKQGCGYQNNKILSVIQKTEIIRSELSRLQIEFESDPDLFRNILNDISRLKSQSYSDKPFLPSSLPPSAFYPVCKAYLQTVKNMDMLDYDDILLKCYALLKSRPDLLDYFRKKYLFILIDEFQDINPVQYEIIKLLAQPLNNIFAVGDDDQSIYSFRGASPDIMKKFLEDFPNASINILNINYRSLSPIMLAATAVIRSNKGRFEKQILCSNSSCPRSAFVLKQFTDYKEEYHAITKEILEYRAKGGTLSEIAILFRNRFDGNRLARHLMKEKIPVRFQGNYPSVFSGFLALDLLAYLQCASSLSSELNTGNNKSVIQKKYSNRANLLRIINKPSRFISRVAFQENSSEDSMSILFRSLSEYYRDNLPVIIQINKLKKDLLFLSNCSPYASIIYILQAIGYQGYLKEYAKSHQILYAELEEDLEELKESCKNLSSLEEWLKVIDEQEEAETNFEKMNRISPNKAYAADAVQIMTMHASKGLEFNIVYLPDLNQDILPGKKATTPEALAEERRILYVAMTRARKSLRMGYTEILRNKKAAPSEFLDCFFH